MPNWCCIGFRVIGDPDELERFTSMMTKTVKSDNPVSRNADGFELIFDFNGIIPMPPEAERDCYEAWAVDNWGTKWNAQDLQLHVGDGFVRFQFDTPWDFPLPVFEALAEEFPDLVFSGSAYEDNGAFAFRGQFNGDDSWCPVEVDRSSDEDDDDQ